MSRGLARGLLGLVRPGNAVAAAVLTFTGAFVAAGGGVWGAAAGPTVAAVLATAAATGGGNAVNDYFDRAVDAVNRPDRPIPRGAVSARGALAFALALFTGAVAAAATLPRVALALAVVNATALAAYTKLFKGLPGVGNLVVALLTGSTFLFGGAAVGRPLAPGLLVMAGLAAAATLGRELVKDVEDVAGDREEGLRTLPIVAGERVALLLAAAAVVASVLASGLPAALGTFGLAYLAVVLPADAVMLHAAVRSFTDAGAGQRRLKAGMFLAAAAFVVGRAATVAGL
ncbi:MAG: geranylgeranylglycerol-phosphate geranylgeranyltransferase [Haloferacaceae archaeon]